MITKGDVIVYKATFEGKTPGQLQLIKAYLAGNYIFRPEDMQVFGSLLVAHEAASVNTDVTVEQLDAGWRDTVSRAALATGQAAEPLATSVEVQKDQGNAILLLGIAALAGVVISVTHVKKK